MSYLRGASGCIYVIDGTRNVTLDVVSGLYARANEAIGPVPAVFLVNKNDVKDSWEIAPEALDALKKTGHPVFETSAKTGMHVESAFRYLAQLMVG
jgi:signal recognition particle receptor subunit beta